MNASIPPIRREMVEQARDYINQLTKPPGSLGRLEEVAAALAGMTGELLPRVTPPGVLVFAADHGVAEEGVSAYPAEVTAQMVYNFANGGAAINAFSRQIGALLQVIDVGVAVPIADERVIQKKVRPGTNNFAKTEAMTPSEAEQALYVGYEQAASIIEQGARTLIVGEMGIGNTTAASALLATLSEEPLERIVGKGSGIQEEMLAHKRDVIRRALLLHRPNPSKPVEWLSKIGGLEIAAMAGAMLAAAERRIPILLDGFICTVAALVARQFAGNVADYMIAGHRSEEPGHSIALRLLGKEPLLDLGLRLGEGSGAAVAFPLLVSATAMVNEMATFASAGVSTADAKGENGK
ncbi:nicotinate-nucleotide--dimethylbenzimidazole phosphoribosyltransferase [Geobacillus stearothermophilus]|jgi:nicotinate-nucleotide--dimethylbenzimidazole phosphoribosyltransferase|uniref:nicotinate-nucleotide--dimethylbenzimidazole phosphoribosyltransferase n=1 Tax=Geobacillus stearothermophilus TaxID=1422 RepID=UPI0025A68B2B|nr:nicotinate-nucleotide--dimethylbenzimidazole phosphoribosyltransferase [Geobacillus stearothermophilus]MED4271447.1 nicotinate-nucleotide--dimethylbenzimidazole phosphoribosyltransferase [Geobacillus stearothermophilus]MED4300479.1 nicotinate-nucleotide--dimethylbenzimidazole phosphoribosyltransferase [Geobacillus stearothermophilus]WJP98919.1 nicotinate-nucleotide--dimethylbenzimidazole phosphoribosyltransferase [Geobacillus stearothermophilus]WJQ02208.1 nicotinate-nucleotide--dimethylbenzi